MRKLGLIFCLILTGCYSLTAGVFFIGYETHEVSINDDYVTITPKLTGEAYQMRCNGVDAELQQGSSTDWTIDLLVANFEQCENTVVCRAYLDLPNTAYSSINSPVAKVTVTELCPPNEI